MTKDADCPQCGKPFEVEGQAPDSAPVCPACEAAGAPARQTVPPGTEIAGYRIERKLASGGMGEIYLATQLTLDRLVAFKILSPEITNDPEAIQSFLDEVRSLGKLEHTNIVTAFDSGHDKGVFFLAMAYVEGVSVDDRITRDGRFSEKETLAVGVQVGDALYYAWNKYHLLHRDIKPANIMIDEAKMAKLLDFGLARSMKDRTSGRPDDKLEGTPNYISPEQAVGRPEMDVRTDIYSLGATMHHMLTGELPYDGITEEELFAKDRMPPLPPVNSFNPSVSQECSAMIRKMTAPEPADRFADWQETLKVMVQARKRASAPPKKRASGARAASGTKLAAGKKVVRKKAPLSAAKPSAGRSVAASARVRPQKKASPLPMVFIVLILAVGAGAYFFMEWSKAKNGATGSSGAANDPVPGAGLDAAQRLRDSFERMGDPDPNDRGSITAVMEALRRMRSEAEGTTLADEMDSRLAELQGQLETLDVASSADPTRTSEAAERETKVQSIVNRMKQDLAANLLGRDFETVKLTLYEAKMKLEPMDAAETIGELAEAAREVARLPEVVMQSFRKQRGSQVDLELSGGTVRVRVGDLEENGVQVEKLVIRGGQVVGAVPQTVKYGDLAPREKARRLGVEDDPARDVMRGLLAYESNQSDLARRYFRVSKHPIARLLGEQFL